MKFFLSRVAAAGVLIIAQLSLSCAPSVNTEKVTGLTPVKIGDNFIKLHPDTVAYPTEAKSYRWNYEQGLMLDAFYRLWKLTGDEKYFRYIKKNIDYYVSDEGEIRTYKKDDYNIDNISPGRVLLHLYSETKNEKYRKAADLLYAQITTHPRTKSGGFWHKKVYPYQMWLDGLYMAQPFYVRYTNMFDMPANYDDIVKQFILIRENLRDERTGLYFHGWDESRQEKWADSVTGRSPNFWGRSIGWFMMALVDVLDYIPETHPGRSELLNIFRDLSSSLLKFRDDKTGLWYQVPDKGTREGNYIETSGSLMFTYAFAKGARLGYLDPEFVNVARTAFISVSENYIRYSESGNFYLQNTVSVSGLGGKPYRDGSFEYYISEPVRENDFKGYGPLLLASIELALIKN